MKHFKSLLLPAMTAAACAVISSCTQEEIVTSNPGRPIEFHLDVQSRGSDKTIANLDTIWVYADDGAETVFEATPFIKDQYGNFKSEEKIYWPDGKENINFTAFWPSPEILNKDYNNCTSTGHTVLNLIPKASTIKTETSIHCGEHFDLITATASATQESANKGIALSFSHAFAQVEFRAKIDDRADHTVVVHSMAFAQVKHFGTYSIGEKKWTIQDNRIHNFYAAPQRILTINNTPQSLTSKTGPMYLLPHNIVMATMGENGVIGKNSFLMVFAKVYRNGELLFPDPDWSDEVKNVRNPSPSGRADINPLLNNSDCVTLRIPLGDNIEIKAGYKYIFTIDFTDGLGYWPKSDPENPGQPVLPNPLSMVDVTVVDWNTATDRDIIP